MIFPHADPEFANLLLIVAEARSLPPALVEKDYWVCHTLWALSVAGWELWFKGGTSLSKGFGLIHRFSEDLDLKLDSRLLPPIPNWSGDGVQATRERREFFSKLAENVVIADCEVQRDLNRMDDRWRSADLIVTYPGHHLAGLGVMSPFVRLEIGNARVTPFVPRDMRSFIHDWLEEAGQLGGYVDNRPRAVRCVHPTVTLIEKLDAIQRRFQKEPLEPAGFVRHFEDAARIIQEMERLPPLEGYGSVLELATEMHRQKQIKELPRSASAAFQYGADSVWAAIEDSHRAIHPMFWGPRVTIPDSCGCIRAWIDSALVVPPHGPERHEGERQDPGSAASQPAPNESLTQLAS